MEIPVTTRSWRVVVIVVLALFAPTGCGLVGETAPTPHAQRGESASARCRPVSLPVRLPSGGDAQLSGIYCLPDPSRPAPSTLQIAVHGGTYNHAYWAWPQEPATYNYVDKATQAGYAVLALDRLGNGASTRPESHQDNSDSQLSTLAQAVSLARSGTLGPQYSRVEYIGHSFGSYYGLALTAQHPELVNALVLTGFGVRQSPDMQQSHGGDQAPARYLPRYSSLDDGYVTNRPGTRAHQLYYLPDADPAVISYDEATEDTLSQSERLTRPKSLDMYTRRIASSVPILIVDGNHDAHYCASDDYDCTSTSSWFAQEAISFPSEGCVAGALEESGHDLQLHRSSPTTDQLILDWSQRTLSPVGQHPATCAVRGPLSTPGVRFQTDPH